MLICPLESTFKKSTLQPFFFKYCNGEINAECSITVEIKCVFLGLKPFIIVNKAFVALSQK